MTCAAVLTGCGGHSVAGGQGSSSSGTAPFVFAVTDAPPTNVTILSAQVTLTGATLNPGGVPVIAGATTLELTRLQTDIAYVSTVNVAAGNYTSLTLTFANPVLTIENDTGSSIISGAVVCTVGTICTISPPTTANLSTTINLPALVVSPNVAAGVLVDVRLDNLLSLTLGADFKNGATATAFVPAGTGAPPVGAEDVVGQVTAINTATNTFTLQNVSGQFSLSADTASRFQQFPSNLCTTAAFACLRTGQIVSVDIGIRSDGAAVARNTVFEDLDSSENEVEGMITGINTGGQQFTMVTLAQSASVFSGLRIGDIATVHYSVTPQTPFTVDFTHADTAPIDTAGYIFSAPADLSVGQVVMVSRNTTSSGTLINADRVRLRSSRVTATVQSIGSPFIQLTNLPSIFSGHGITQIQAQTSQATIFVENNAAINLTQVPVASVISVRGPLFNVSGTRTLVASKVVVKP